MKKGCRSTTVIFFAAIIILFIALYYFFIVPHEVKINKYKYPVSGIDISRHTGKVDFKKIIQEYSDSIYFVYIKATEGRKLVDKNFNKNYKNARKHKFCVGAYHFFRFNVSGADQAYNFLKTIKGKNFDLAPVLDVEEWGNVKNKERKVVIREIKNFVRIVEEKQKTKILFYSNESSFRTYLESDFKQNDIWICSFNKKPAIKKKWIFWQYSHNGKLPGAQGMVDLNIFNGSVDDWNRFVGKSRNRIGN